tara:strand:- start:312 stop:617 length:306 start_codon:yes stop_codon:yes gene_type:complete
MMMKKKKIKYNIGDILAVKTFAGPVIYKKVISLVNKKTKWQDGSITHVKGFEGCFVRRKDLYALKRSCVPYTGKEVLRKTNSFTYEWQILKVIKQGVKNGS